MEDKSSKTMWTVIIGILLIAGVIFVLYNLWKIVLGAVVGLIFGYKFGYTKGKESRK
jgi:predicted membrane protein